MRGPLADVQYQLCKVEVNQCTKVFYHELSKHVHGNTAELSMIDTEQPRWKQSFQVVL